MIRLIVLSLFVSELPETTQASEPKTPPNVIVSDDFEQWSWEPITFSMRESGRKRLKAGKRLPFEHRGPLYRVAKGFGVHSGRMVKGKEAFKLARRLPPYDVEYCPVREARLLLSGC